MKALHATLAALVAVAAALHAAPADAGVFSVTPVRIYMTPRDRAIAVTLTNEGNTEVVLQADVYEWKQKPDGTDDLVLSEDMILAPPIIKLAPLARQVVRLARTQPPPAGQQLTYRLVVREIPEARPPAEGVQLQVALAFSLPVFITPPGAKRQLSCDVERIAPDKVAAVCENNGNAYAQPVDFVLAGEAGLLAKRDTGGYILPGTKRRFELTAAQARVAGGRLRMTVTQDDASQQVFDVVLPD